MDFWGKKVNVSMEAAARQVAIINSLPHERRLQIALEFTNMGFERTFEWIRSTHPEFSEWEVKLEFVRLMYYESGEMSEEHWQHVKSTYEEIIRKDWVARFKAMMATYEWSYEDVAKWGRFKNGKVIEATISRGLPSFAKLAVVVFEQQQKRKQDSF